MENPADVGELVFESIDTPGLIKCLEVSQTGKKLAENVLRHVKMEKQKLYKNYFLKAVKKKVDSGLNNKDERGCTVFMIACEKGHEDVVQTPIVPALFRSKH